MPPAPKIHVAAAPEIKLPNSCPVFPDPVPINTLPVVWQVITPTTTPEGEEWVLFALDTDQYENLSLTTADILRWVKEASWRLNKHKEHSEKGNDDE